jgi:hypothetical protein
MPDADIDYSDIPPLDEEFFKDFYQHDEVFDEFRRKTKKGLGLLAKNLILLKDIF